MANEADIGYGTTVEVADPATPATRILLGGSKNITLPNETTDQHDTTDMQSPNKTREFVGGLTDAGEFSFDMNWVPGNATDKAIAAMKGKKRLWFVTFTNGCQLLFKGNRQGYDRNVPLDDVKGASLTVKVSGEAALTDPTAPRNIVLPTITGTPKVGYPLELDWGIWAGATDYAIQWKSAGTNIAGATSTTFVPAAAQQGTAITVTVTASNKDFNTAATSAATANVAAA